MIIWLIISLLLNMILIGLTYFYTYQLGNEQNSDTLDILQALSEGVDQLKDESYEFVQGYHAATRTVLTTLKSKRGYQDESQP